MRNLGIGDEGGPRELGCSLQHLMFLHINYLEEAVENLIMDFYREILTVSVSQMWMLELYVLSQFTLFENMDVEI